MPVSLPPGSEPQADRILRVPSECRWPLARLFHENTRGTRASLGALGEHIEEMAKDPITCEKAAFAYKSYPTAKTIPLSSSRRKGRRGSLSRILLQRRTRRTFGQSAVSLNSLGNLLDLGCGTSGKIRLGERKDLLQSLRTYPSAGGLYPLEVYAIAFRISGLPRGIHHYNAYHHSLEQIDGIMDEPRAREILYVGNLEGPIAFVLVITAVVNRVLEKYGDRGYRYLLLEAGHLCQNLLLLAEEMDLHPVPLGGFLDEELANALGIESGNEWPLYAVAVGSKE